MRRLAAVVLALIVVAPVVADATQPPVPDPRAYLRELLHGAFGWVPSTDPAPTPTPRPTAKPKPVPPTGWLDAFCLAVTYYGEVYYHALGVRRLARKRTLRAAIEGGQISGHLVVAAVRMAAAAKEWPRWERATAMRRAMIQLGSVAQRLAWAGVYEPVAPGGTARAWRRFTKADRAMARAGRGVDFDGTCG